MMPHTGPLRRGRALLALALTFAVSLVLVEVTVTLPSPGAAASQVGYSFVTYGSWSDLSPAWSPDGKTIAYLSNRNGGWQVFTMEPDGSFDKAITPTSYNARPPSWSPDSSSLAFWSQGTSGTDVRIAFVANSTIKTITDGGTSTIEARPQWSPDGTRLLFFVGSGASTLVSYDLRTQTAEAVATVTGGDLSASWISRTEVAFSSQVQGDYAILWADVANGTHGVFLEGNSSFSSPAVSAVTSKLAYISNLVPPNPYGREYLGTYSPGDYNVWVVGLDGSNASFQYGLVPIAGEAVPQIQPWQLYACPFTPAVISPSQALAWSPNGKVIAYVARRGDDTPQVYLWDVFQWASTTGPIVLSMTNSTDPTWSPDGVTLAFASATGGFYHIFIIDTTEVIAPLPIGSRDG
jgi:Tol biopolymer transport system component